jgi:antitoxin (DNA-binding transcriptional repressor) of toxin-antitoxin stability system
MKTANVQEVPQQWTEILRWVAAGEEVQVTSEGLPVAGLTPWNELRPFIGATAGGPALPPDLDEPTGEKW